MFTILHITILNMYVELTFQTSKTCHDAYVLDMIKNILPHDWKYEFYNDENIIQFL